MNTQQRNRWTLGDWVGLVGGITGLLALIVSGLTWFENRETRKIADKAFNRATGRLDAKFVVRGVLPEKPQLPEDMFYLLPKENEKVVHFKSTGDLAKLNLRIKIENIGEEVIDAIRIEIEATQVSVRGARRVGDRTDWIDAFSWNNPPPSFFVIPFDKKLPPREFAVVPLLQSLMLQIDGIMGDNTTEKNVSTTFKIRSFCRIVGGPVFDPEERREPVAIECVWSPAGFPVDARKNIIKGPPPVVTIEQQ